MTVDTEPRVNARDHNPHDHVVLFYDSTAQLVTHVGQFVIDGVLAGETSVVVATAPHLAQFELALSSAGMDVEATRAAGNLLTIDAGEAMSRFLVAEWPEAQLFESEVGGLIRQLSASGRPVRVYGEMVSLLWDAGQVAAAVQLEALWNELRRHVPFALLCAYPAASVHGNDESFQQLCDCHSSVVGQAHPNNAPPDRLATFATRSFPGDSISLRAARQFVVDTLHGWKLGHVADDAAIVVSELATNAILHAQSDFGVAVSLDNGNVRIAVRDASPDLPVMRDPSPTTISGRGLVLVSALGARWGTDEATDGKEVWVELRY